MTLYENKVHRMKTKYIELREQTPGSSTQGHLVQYQQS